MATALDGIRCSREGSSGAVVVLVHGGAGPELTWSRQHELAGRLQLVIPWRRGYPPSPPAERQDWEVDARDLLQLLPQRAHVVAHSYGGVGATVAATLCPERFSSLTLIESPLWFVAADDPEVRRIVRLSQSFFAGSDPQVSAQFLRLAGLPVDHPETQRIERLKRATRDPGEARPALDIIRKAGIPTMIISGDHDQGLERLSDALASELGSERAIIAGARHAVPQAHGFNDRLLGFLETAERTRPSNAAPRERHEQ